MRLKAVKTFQVPDDMADDIVEHAYDAAKAALADSFCSHVKFKRELRPGYGSQQTQIYVSVELTVLDEQEVSAIIDMLEGRSDFNPHFIKDLLVGNE